MDRLSISQAAELLKSKQLSSEELTSQMLEKIRLNNQKIGAYLEVFEEDALAQAKKVDELRVNNPEQLPPYSGIPLAIKDNMNIFGKQMNCASRILKGYKAAYDATVVSRIKEQQMVILGRLNMDEFAMGSSTETSALQKTVNPWNVDAVPGGSSGGSAAAVAAELAMATLGSDTGGSIRQPASFCGVVGFKPTYGRVSRYGLGAFASSLDQIGPLTGNLDDAAIIYDIIKGFDPLDSTSMKLVESSSYQLLQQDFDLKGKKFAVPEKVLDKGVEPGVKKVIEEIVRKITDSGGVVEEVKFETFDYALAVYYLIATAEASANLSRYDGVRYGYRADAEDVFNLFEKTRAEGFGDEVKRRIMLGTYVLSSGYYDAYYIKAQKVRTLIRNDYQRIFKDYDAVLSPTSPTVAFKFGEKTDDPLTMYLSDIMTIPVNLAGLPGISIPVGLSEGLPVGLQLTADVLQDNKLLQLAKGIEQLAAFEPLKI